MQPSIRRYLPAFLAAVLLTLSSIIVLDAVADDSMLVVSLAGKFKPCGADNPGCEHILLLGDPASEPNQHVYRFTKGYVFPKHWHVSNENLVMVRGLITINAEGSNERTLKAGDYVHIPAKVVHWGVCPEDCVFYLGVDGPDSFNLVEDGK
jgi:quercetin dioxygenase-like cupin family protein